MDRYKKAFMLWVAALSAAVVLAGCSAASSSAPASGGKEGEEVVGRITALTENSITLETINGTRNLEPSPESGLEPPAGQEGQLPQADGPGGGVISGSVPQGIPDGTPPAGGKAGEEVTFSLDGSTLYLENEQSIARADLAVGDFVAVQHQDGRALRIEKAAQMQDGPADPNEKGGGSSQADATVPDGESVVML